MTVPAPEEYLRLAREHLERVLEAWDPPEWMDLATYGFYCLEATVMAGAGKLGIRGERSHGGKQSAAKALAQRGLPDVSALLRDLNEARKSRAYGDVPFPDLDPEDVAIRVEQFVDAIAGLFK